MFDKQYKYAIRKTLLGAGSVIIGGLLLGGPVFAQEAVGPETIDPVVDYTWINDNEEVPYETEYRENPNLPKGEERVIQKGKVGYMSGTFAVSPVPNIPGWVAPEGYFDKRSIGGEPNVHTPPITEIIEIGTGVVGEEVMVETRTLPMLDPVEKEAEVVPKGYQWTTPGRQEVVEITTTTPTLNGKPSGNPIVTEKVITKGMAPTIHIGTGEHTEWNTVHDPIPFETEYRDTPDLPQGEERVIQAGVEGEERTVVFFRSMIAPFMRDWEPGEWEILLKHYNDIITTEVTREPVTEIIEVGTGVVGEEVTVETRTMPVPEPNILVDIMIPDGYQYVAEYSKGTGAVVEITTTTPTLNGKPNGEPVVTEKVIKRAHPHVIFVGAGGYTANNSRYEPIPFETEYRENPELPEGERKVVQVGVEGEERIVFRLPGAYYTIGEKSKEEIEALRSNQTEIGRETMREPVTEIIEVGTLELPKSSQQIEIVDEPFETEYRENPNLPEGEEKVIQKGVPGEKEVIITSGTPSPANPTGYKEEERMTKEPVNQIVEVGTGVVDELIETQTVEIPFETQIIEDNDLPEGDGIIEQQGVAGKKTITTTTPTFNGNPYGDSVVKEEVVKEPVTEIRRVGTGEKPIKTTKDQNTQPDPNTGAGEGSGNTHKEVELDNLPQPGTQDKKTEGNQVVGNKESGSTKGDSGNSTGTGKNAGSGSQKDESGGSSKGAKEKDNTHSSSGVGGKEGDGKTTVNNQEKQNPSGSKDNQNSGNTHKEVELDNLPKPGTQDKKTEDNQADGNKQSGSMKEDGGSQKDKTGESTPGTKEGDNTQSSSGVGGKEKDDAKITVNNQEKQNQGNQKGNQVTADKDKGGKPNNSQTTHANETNNNSLDQEKSPEDGDTKTSENNQPGSVVVEIPNESDLPTTNTLSKEGAGDHHSEKDQQSAEEIKGLKDNPAINEEGLSESGVENGSGQGGGDNQSVSNKDQNDQSTGQENALSQDKDNSSTDVHSEKEVLNTPNNQPRTEDGQKSEEKSHQTDDKKVIQGDSSSDKDNKESSPFNLSKEHGTPSTKDPLVEDEDATQSEIDVEVEVVYDNKLPAGHIQVDQEGKPGVLTTTTSNPGQTNQPTVTEKVTQEMEPKVVRVGTGDVPANTTSTSNQGAKSNTQSTTQDTVQADVKPDTKDSGQTPTQGGGPQSQSSNQQQPTQPAQQAQKPATQEETSNPRTQETYHIPETGESALTALYGLSSLVAGAGLVGTSRRRKKK